MQSPAFADDARDTLTVETLLRLKRHDLSTVKPETKAAVLRHIDTHAGTPRFVELVNRFNIHERNDALLKLALDKPDDALGVTAAAALLKLGGADAAREAMNDNDEARAAKAVRVFGATQHTEVLPLIAGLVVDPARNVNLRSEAVRALGRGPEGEKALLSLVTSKKLPDDLHFPAANILLISRDEKTREEAGKYLSLPATGSGQPLPPIAELAKRTGDAANGQTVYIKATCVTCHKAGEIGIDFGPALTEIGSKLSREAMYEAILAPSAGISFGYEAWLVTPADTTPVLGFIASETEDQLTVKQMGGVAVTIKKADIKSREKQPISLMTPNLQQIMTEQELVDLVEYLANLKKPTP